MDQGVEGDFICCRDLGKLGNLLILSQISNQESMALFAVKLGESSLKTGTAPSDQEDGCALASQGGGYRVADAGSGAGDENPRLNGTPNRHRHRHNHEVQGSRSILAC